MWIKQFIAVTLYNLKSKMEAYYTPVKEVTNCMPKTVKSNAQAREGDWICFNCHNLNFSFRKKCNRCKTQTRQQNQSAAILINYYSKNYLFPHPNTQHHCGHASHTTTSANSNQPPLTPYRLDKENRTPEKVLKDLPSVSPLVKKYNARETTPQSEAKSEESYWGVTVRDFEDVLGSSGRSEEWEQQNRGDDSSSSEQIQRMINSIML